MVAPTSSHVARLCWSRRMFRPAILLFKASCEAGRIVDILAEPSYILRRSPRKLAGKVADPLVRKQSQKDREKSISLSKQIISLVASVRQ